MVTFTKHLMVSGLLVSAGAVAAQGTQQRGLHELMVAAGKLFFATATDTNNFNDSAYQTIVKNKNEFGMYVPENSQKFEPTEPQQGDFQFTNPDAVMKQAASNGQTFRCHTLIWHNQLPNFITTTAWTRDTLTKAIQDHISAVMAHYKGQCYSWDVVNEALNENGTFRNSVFFKTLGTDYIPIAFKAAAAADPQAKLYYNDFNLETSKTKADGAVKIVQLLQDANVRIDGVGFQAHMKVGGTPSKANLVATLNRFTSMGMEVSYTELDIAHTRLPANATALQQQARDYVTMFDSCLAVEKCVGITAWQFTDKYSWIPSTFPGQGDACLYNANYTKKPAHTSVASLLAAAATGTATQSNRTTSFSGSGLANSASSRSGAKFDRQVGWAMVLGACLLAMAL